MSRHQEPLDSGNIEDIARSKAVFEQKAQFQWAFYSDLAYQRNKIYDKLKNSLREQARPAQCTNWQRAVRYKYALDPLSMKGSLKDPGGRFNIGAIDPSRHPMFPALYIASDKGTALAELLGRNTTDNSLTPEEIALTKPDSVATVSVSGKFDAILDVRDHTALVGFVDLIKGFRVSPALAAKAKARGETVDVVKTPERLALEFTRADWRVGPAIFDVPAPSQIFARIVLDAEIEGVIYSSTLTEKACLALYPQNFQNSLSYIELDDSPPPGVNTTRIDSANCKETSRI